MISRSVVRLMGSTALRMVALFRSDPTGVSGGVVIVGTKSLPGLPGHRWQGPSVQVMPGNNQSVRYLLGNSRRAPVPVAPSVSSGL